MTYYGYRFYSPGLGRWINRDPLGENGGLNLYGFAGNTPVNAVDPYGLMFFDNYINSGSSSGSGYSFSFFDGFGTFPLGMYSGGYDSIFSSFGGWGGGYGGGWSGSYESAAQIGSAKNVSNSSWVNRFAKNYKENLLATNNFFFGDWTRISKVGIGAITSGAVAKRIGGVTLFDLLRVLPKGGYPTLGVAGTLRAFLLTTAVNSALSGIALEGGILAGSFVNAIPVYGTGQSVGDWWVDGTYYYFHPEERY